MNSALVLDQNQILMSRERMKIFQLRGEPLIIVGRGVFVFLFFLDYTVVGTFCLDNIADDFFIFLAPWFLLSFSPVVGRSQFFPTFACLAP